MSYCRWMDGDVYMYHHVDGGIECCGCVLDKQWSFPNFLTRSEAIEHLNKHVAAGDRVPEYAFDMLRSEIKELGDVV